MYQGSASARGLLPAGRETHAPPTFAPASMAAPPSPPAAEPTGTLRRMLGWLLALGIAGLAAELLLLEHTESALQWIPLALLASGAVGLALVALRPARWTLRLMRAVMVLCVAAGCLGVFLHLRGNVEFERESDPAAAFGTLLARAFTGATPALSPGALLQLGLLGLAFTFRHPAARRS